MSGEEYQPLVRPEDRIKAQAALHLVAAATGVPAEQMAQGPRLTGAACRARWLAVYLSYITFGWSLDRVSHVFAITRSTAAKACRWSEDERDRPDLDGRLDGLEGLLRAVFDAPRLELPA